MSNWAAEVPSDPDSDEEPEQRDERKRMELMNDLLQQDFNNTAEIGKLKSLLVKQAKEGKAREKKIEEKWGKKLEFKENEFKRELKRMEDEILHRLECKYRERDTQNTKKEVEKIRQLETEYKEKEKENKKKQDEKYKDAQTRAQQRENEIRKELKELKKSQQGKETKRQQGLIEKHKEILKEEKEKYQEKECEYKQEIEMLHTAIKQITIEIQEKQAREEELTQSIEEICKTTQANEDKYKLEIEKLHTTKQLTSKIQELQQSERELKNIEEQHKEETTRLNTTISLLLEEKEKRKRKTTTSCKKEDHSNEMREAIETSDDEQLEPEPLEIKTKMFKQQKRTINHTDDKPATRDTCSTTQCFRCQQFGHIQTQCRDEARCVKCAGKHHSSACDRLRTSPATCINCGGSHPASYRGCKKYPKPLNQIRRRTTSEMEPALKIIQQMFFQLIETVTELLSKQQERTINREKTSTEAKNAQTRICEEQTSET